MNNRAADSRVSRPGRAYRFARFVGRLGAIAMVIVVAVYLLLPWLGRSGNLNAVFEDIVRSTFALEIEIGAIDTEPLSHLKVTRLRSVSASAAGKLDFRASEIEFSYSPVDLWSGRLERLEISGPTMFLNLDENLGGLAHVPEAPPRPDGERAAITPAEEEARFIPLTIGAAVIRSGDVKLRFAGHTFAFEQLRVEVNELGRRQGQRFALQAELLGAKLEVRGALGLPTPASPTSAQRFEISDATVSLSRLELRRLARWLGDESPLGVALAANPTTIDLTGRLRGAWPERLDLELDSHADEIAAAATDEIRVRGGAAELRIAATVSEAAERVEFDVTLVTGGDIESSAGSRAARARVVARGEYRRGAEAEGRIRLDELEIDLAEQGRVRASGSIDRLSAGSSAVLDLEISASALDAASIVALLTSPGAVRSLSERIGPLDFDVHALGTARETRLDGSLLLPLGGTADVTNVLRAQFEGLRFDPADESIAAEKLHFETNSARVLWWQELLREHGLEPGGDWDLSGELGVKLAAERPRWSAGGVSGELDLTLGLTNGHLARADLWAEATGVRSDLTVTTVLDSEERRHPLNVRLELRVDEFLAGDVAGAPGATPGIASGSGTWSGWPSGRAELSLDELEISTPLTGESRGRLRWRAAAAEPADDSRAQFELDLDTRSVPLPHAWNVFVREPFEAGTPFLADSTFTGELDFALRVRAPPAAGEPTIEGRAHLVDGAAVVGGIRAEGVELEVPFSSRSPRPEGPSGREQAVSGHIAATKLIAWGWQIDRLSLPLRYRDGIYGLGAEQRWPLYGGELRVRGASFSPRAPAGATWRIDAVATDVELARLALARDWPALTGKAGAVWRPLRLRGNRIEWNGDLTVEAFGGRLSFTDLSAEDLFQPYASFELRRGRLENLRLDRLGEWLRFGVASGVLSGSLDDLEVVGGELAKMRLDLETVPVAGVNQYLDRRAIESIRRVLEGPLGAVEETFFSRFWFEHFGFTATLDGDAFQLAGKHEEGGLQYIVLGEWYQFPRISIINANPGQIYDWDRIRQNLDDIWRPDDEP